MEQYSYTSTHRLSHTGPVTGSLYLYIKTNQMHQCIKFILVWCYTLHVSDGISVHHQQFKTVHRAAKQTLLSAC